MFTRNLGIRISVDSIKKFKDEDIDQMFEVNQAFMAKNHLSTIEFLNKTISNIEKQVLAQVREHQTKRTATSSFPGLMWKQPILQRVTARKPVVDEARLFAESGCGREPTLGLALNQQA